MPTKKDSDVFKREMEAAYDLVDAKYDSAHVLGSKGSQMLLRLAARSCVHEFPYAMAVLSAMPACANGALIKGFTQPSPLSLIFLNCNVPQTKKSQINIAMADVTKAIDGSSKKAAEYAVRSASQVEMAADPRGGGPSDHTPHSAAGVGTPANSPGGGPSVQIRTSTLTSFTEAEFFHRCAFDWRQLASPDSGPGTDGRFCHSVFLNLDEAYKFAKMLGLVLPGNTGGHRAGSGASGHVDASSLPDAASEFNRLMQTGNSSLATKTAGSFGEGVGEPVGVGGGGNLHPSVWIPVTRGEAGCHLVAQRERLLVACGRPISSHEALLSSLKLPADFKRWCWSPLHRVMLSALGLQPGTDEADTAAEIYERVQVAAGEESDNEDNAEAQYHPDVRGYRITLDDGVSTRLRFQRRGTALSAEFRLANRDIPISESESLLAIAQRILAYFGDKNIVISLSTEASNLFKGLQACFEVQVAKLRSAGEYTAAARQGTGAWHTLMLSGCLLAFDIGIGAYGEQDAEFVERALCVQPRHVLRAYDLVLLFHSLADIWVEPPAAEEMPVSALQSQSLANAEQRLHSVVQGGTAAQSHFSEFQLTQLPRAETDGSDVGPSAGGPAASPAATVPAAEPTILNLGDPSLAPMTEGYGINGASVQDPKYGQVLFPDRVLMQKTLLRGEATIYAFRVVDSISVKRKRTDGRDGYTKCAVRIDHWKAVMEAGLGQHRIGTYSDGQSCTENPGKARVTLDIPTENSPLLRAEYHNRLMRLCQVSFVQLSDRIMRRHSGDSAQKRPVAAEAGGTSLPSGASVGVAPAAGEASIGSDAAPGGQIAVAVADAGAIASQPVLADPASRAVELGFRNC